MSSDTAEAEASAEYSSQPMETPMFFCFVDDEGEACAIDLTIQPLAEIYQTTDDDGREITEMVFKTGTGRENVLVHGLRGFRLLEVIRFIHRGKAAQLSLMVLPSQLEEQDVVQAIGSGLSSILDRSHDLGT